MADAGAGPAGAGLPDIAAASAFLRRLSEPQRLAIVGRAHAIVTAVLQHATPTIQAGTPIVKAGTPPRLSFDPAGLPDVQPTQQQQQQQQQQQLFQVPSLRPRDTGALTACASDPDLYAAFTEAGADTATTADGLVAPESANAAADAAIAATAAAPDLAAKLSAAPPLQAPGPRVLVTEPGCTACQDQTASGGSSGSSSSSSSSSHLADSFATAPARADSSRPPAMHAVAEAAQLKHICLLPPRRTSSDAAARLYSSFADGDSHLAAPVVGGRDGSFWQAVADVGAAAALASRLPAVAEQESMEMVEQLPAKADPELPLGPDVPTSSSDYSSCSAGTAASDSGSDAAENRHSTSSDLKNSAGGLGSRAEAPVQKQGLSQRQPCSPFASPCARSPFAAATEAAGALSATSPARPPVKPPLVAKNRLGSLQREVSRRLQALLPCALCPVGVDCPMSFKATLQPLLLQLLLPLCRHDTTKASLKHFGSTIWNPQDSGALPWQEAMRAQRAFAARKAAAAEADGTAAEASPAPLLHATGADPRVPRPVSPAPGSSCVPAPKAMMERGADAPATAKPSSTVFGAKSAITEDALEAACAEEELLEFSSESLKLPAAAHAATCLNSSLATVCPTQLLIHGPPSYLVCCMCIRPWVTWSPYRQIACTWSAAPVKQRARDQTVTKQLACPPPAGSRSPPPAHIMQRMSLDLALASTSMQRMALRFEDVKICRRPGGSLWKLGSGGFGTVSAAGLTTTCRRAAFEAAETPLDERT